MPWRHASLCEERHQHYTTAAASRRVDILVSHDCRWLQPPVDNRVDGGEERKRCFPSVASDNFLHLVARQHTLELLPVEKLSLWGTAVYGGACPRATRHTSRPSNDADTPAMVRLVYSYATSLLRPPIKMGLCVCVDGHAVSVHTHRRRDKVCHPTGFEKGIVPDIGVQCLAKTPHLVQPSPHDCCLDTRPVMGTSANTERGAVNPTRSTCRFPHCRIIERRAVMYTPRCWGQTPSPAPSHTPAPRCFSACLRPSHDAVCSRNQVRLCHTHHTFQSPPRRA